MYEMAKYATGMGTTMGHREFTAACHIRHHGQPDPHETRHCSFSAKQRKFIFKN
jgi:hypothetical protein